MVDHVGRARLPAARPGDEEARDLPRRHALPARADRHPQGRAEPAGGVRVPALVRHPSQGGRASGSRRSATAWPTRRRSTTSPRTSPSEIATSPENTKVTYPADAEWAAQARQDVLRAGRTGWASDTLADGRWRTTPAAVGVALLAPVAVLLAVVFVWPFLRIFWMAVVRAHARHRQLPDVLRHARLRARDGDHAAGERVRHRARRRARDDDRLGAAGVTVADRAGAAVVGGALPAVGERRRAQLRLHHPAPARGAAQRRAALARRHRRAARDPLHRDRRHDRDALHDAPVRDPAAVRELREHRPRPAACAPRGSAPRACGRSSRSWSR